MEKKESEPTMMHVILMNDLVLLTKQKMNNKTGKVTYELKSKISLEEARIVMLGDTDSKNISCRQILILLSCSACFRDHSAQKVLDTNC